MKSKLSIGILMLLFISLCLYLTNSYEYMTDKEEDSIVSKVYDLVGTTISEKVNQNVDKVIGDIKNNPECLGPQGPSGPAGGNYIAYQGIYSLSDNYEQPLTTNIKNLNVTKKSNGDNNKIILRTEKINPLKLRDTEKWQFSDNYLINRKKDNDKFNLRICQQDDNNDLFLCTDNKLYAPFDYIDNQFVSKKDDKLCISLDEKKGLVLNDCINEDKSKFKDSEWSLR